MKGVVREYNAVIDKKRRFVVRGAIFKYFHVTEYEDGLIVLHPRLLTDPRSESGRVV